MRSRYEIARQMNADQRVADAGWNQETYWVTLNEGLFDYEGLNTFIEHSSTEAWKRIRSAAPAIDKEKT